MSVLAVITDRAEAYSTLSWAVTIARSKREPLVVLCWSYSKTVRYPLLSDEGELADNDTLVMEAREHLDQLAEEGGRQAKSEAIETENVEIRRAIAPDLINAILAEIRAGKHGCVLAAAEAMDLSEDATTQTESNPLLRRSPCETIILRRCAAAPAKSPCVLVVATDSAHDQVALETFSNAALETRLKLTLARVEDEGGAEATELGRREIKRLMRASGIKASDRIKRRVFSRDSWKDFLTLAEAQNLVLIGANQQFLFGELQKLTSNPVIAVIKRAPPLQRLSWSGTGRWKTKLSPADYADMMQGLRRGADLNTDFLIMLGLAAGIASLGLLQDSPAVVIGSMLLAPLMTPMIACGLAIAQGNKKLGRRSMGSIAVGFLLTLAVSFVVAIIAPGNEITAEIAARGDPNILDLLIALLSAAAAAYALARPNIVGAIAGVAIATALVPPLCSAGISLAYREYFNAFGASVLFGTNVGAIILGAAITFRLLGVTDTVADDDQRRWAFRISTAILVILLVLAYPLQLQLNERIDQGQTQPRNYPLTQLTEQALGDFLERSPEIELVASGRPSTLHDKADVVLVLSSPQPLSSSFKDELVEICRMQMQNAELVVEVHCFLDAWTDEDN